MPAFVRRREKNQFFNIACGGETSLEVRTVDHDALFRRKDGEDTVAAKSALNDLDSPASGGPRADGVLRQNRALGDALRETREAGISGLCQSLALSREFWTKSTVTSGVITPTDATVISSQPSWL